MTLHTATRSRNRGRGNYSVIFRHPAMMDLGTGQPGRRLRMSLGTSDETEADILVDELNEILGTRELWDRSARVDAASRFDGRVVEIFYNVLEATPVDFTALREEFIPLPGAADGYRKVLLLGTTGAGKTTVVRQILGTDPDSERFPSTSTAKTTVADTELITTDDDTYRAVVTFAPRAEVIDYLAENVSAAALAVFNGKSDDEVTRRLLDHVNQRFRFSYVLGRSATMNPDDVVDDDVVDDGVDDIDPDEYGRIDLGVTVQVVQGALHSLREVVERHAHAVRAEFAASKDDERVVTEYIEENLDTELRQSDEFHSIVDSLIDEIEKRFATLEVGELRRNGHGWPTSWSWATGDRAAFVRVVTRFSSNYAPLFGRLLTPLVNGIRVSGPFAPKWAAGPPRLVLVDGEGLGHTPKSAAKLSSSVVRQLEEVDAVLLVDNATQPMQAAPVAALKSIAVSGNGMKLYFLFTHFDQVGGDNLPTFSAREEHVRASVENVLRSIGEDSGSSAERVLRRRLERARYFVGGIHEPLNPRRKTGSRSIRQFQDLLALLANPESAADVGPSRPVYDRMSLPHAVTEATKSFHKRWNGLLGLDPKPTVPKEHWARVKALSRRLAEEWSDEYDNLKPVADLLFELQRQLYLMLQRPVRWTGGQPNDDAIQAILDEVSNAITKELIDLTRRRLMEDVRDDWQAAYKQHGVGSTLVRAHIIASDVYERGAPVLPVSASQDQNSLLGDVADIVSQVANKLDVVFQ